MMQIITFIFLVTVVVIIFILLRSKPVFVIAVKAGRIKSSRGKIPKKFMDDCELLVQELNLSHGKIRGFRKGNKVTLRFSFLIPKKCHQRFRNIWHFHM